MYLVLQDSRLLGVVSSLRGNWHSRPLTKRGWGRASKSYKRRKDAGEALLRRAVVLHCTMNGFDHKAVCAYG